MEMISNSSWATAVLDALHGYQQNGFLCDYTLAANDGSTLAVHSCVLAAASPLLYEHLNQTDSTVKTLECSAYAVQAVVNYAYSGVLDVQNCVEEEVGSLLSLLSLPLSTLEDEANDASTASPFHDATVCGEVTAAEHAPKEDHCKDVFVDETGTIQCHVSDAIEDKTEVYIFNSNELHLVDEKNPERVNLSDDVNSGTFSTTECDTGDAIGTKASMAGSETSKMECCLNSTDQGQVAKEIVPDKSLVNSKDKECGLIEGHINCDSVAEKFVCTLCDTSFAVRSVLLAHEKVCKASIGVRIKRKCRRRFHAKKSVHECPRCGDYLSNARSLQKHLNVVHDGIRPFSCEICTKKFSEKVTLLEHIRIHTGERPIECEHCAKTFRSGGNYRRHLIRCAPLADGTKAKHICSICEKTFSSEKLRDKHKKSHVVTCDICGKTISCSRSLANHKKLVHEGIRKFSCETCGKAFGAKATLASHKNVHTRLKTFECRHCNKFFASKKYCTRHERICLMSEDKSKYCTICCKSFSSEQAKNEHVKSHVVTCELCEKSFVSLKNLQKHRRIVHDGIKDFCCEICGEAFSRKEQMEIHAVSHTGVKQFQCRYCTTLFGTQNTCRKHEKICKDELELYNAEGKQYSCPICQELFTSKRKHDLHNRRFHSNSTNSLCTLCGKTFSVESFLKKHMKLVHCEKKFICTTCQKKFKTKGTLKEHCHNVHSGEKTFLCTSCGKGFSCNQHLKMHELTHTERVREIPCNVCEKLFHSETALKLHERCHSSKRPFKCPYCDRGFVRKVDLQVHERSHTGERPYKCSECDKAFASCHGLISHRRSHTGERPYHCTMCPTTYVHGGKLKIHYREKHGVEYAVRKYISKEDS